MELTLNGENFFYKFISGIEEVLKFRDHLNNINVFPVADGDTGTNLASTMNSIVENSRVNDSVTYVAKSIADAAITGARGNSGIIFAQFIQGISDSLEGKAIITLKEYAGAMKTAVQYAYKAMNKPVEGTILTVMKDWASSLHELQHKAKNFSELIGKSVAEARKSLKTTTGKLDILKKAGVVDAGAEGFVRFLEGVEKYIVHKKKVVLKSLGIPKTNESSHLVETEIKFRYCTEAIIKEQNINMDTLKTELSRFGDSVIAAGNPTRVRIHVHTDTPDRIFKLLMDTGTVTEPKVDDMKKQNDAHFHRKYSIAVVTDTSCDLPEEILDLYQVFTVPFNISYGEHHLLDKITLKHSDFYRLHKDDKNYPKSSQPSIKAFENIYGFLTTYYDKIISIHISEKLSGTYNAAKQAAAKFKNKRIEVINSKTLATSLGLIVLKIVREIEKGTDFDEIIKHTDEYIKNSEIYVGIRTLKYLVRSGRVSPLKGFIANLLHLKPIISLDEEGKTAQHQKTLSFNASLNKIVKMVKQYNDQNPVENFIIGHVFAVEDAKRLAGKVRKVLNKEPLSIINVSPIIGAHAGEGAVCVSFIS